jgi:hypothetical protein
MLVHAGIRSLVPLIYCISKSRNICLGMFCIENYCCVYWFLYAHTYTYFVLNVGVLIFTLLLLVISTKTQLCESLYLYILSYTMFVCWTTCSDDALLHFVLSHARVFVVVLNV